MTLLDASAFDFWLGEWDCEFEGGHATNSIMREFDGHVIVERFAADRPQAFAGTSLSVFDERVGWRQAWVAQGGSYWHFVGALVDGNPAFSTPERVDEPALYKRMVFTDITTDTFRWRWESSPDGEAWTVNWQIAYTRRP